MVITLVSGLLLGMVYEVTKDPIKKQEAEQKIAACQKVFEGAEEFKAIEERRSSSADDIRIFAGSTDGRKRSD